MSDPLVAGLLVFPGLTQLDMTGPYEVLARLPGWRAEIVARTMDPVRTDKGLTLLPTIDFASAPQLDLLVVPGGPGTDDLLLDAEPSPSSAGRAARRSTSSASAPAACCSARPGF